MRTLWLAPTLLAILAVSNPAGAVGSCGSSGPLGETVSVDHEGSLYYVTTPSGYDETVTWPLILGLHGDEGDPADSVNWFWRDVADNSFIFVAPKAPNESGSWYDETESNSVWMDSVLARVLAEYNVDLDRIYIWGLSGGAMFTSDYALARQDVFAAVEYNMGGSARGYMPAPSEACRIPARFVVSETDFLRENALGLFDELTQAGHETVWVDADCEGHCFDEEQAGPVARDWLMSFTLCGATPTTGCSDSPGDPVPIDTTTTTSTTGATGSDGSSTDGSSTDGSSTDGSSTDSSTSSTSGAPTSTSSGGTTTTSSSAGGSTTSSGMGGASSAAVTTGAGGTGDFVSTSAGTTEAATPEQAGCACRAPASRPGSGWAWLLPLAAIAWRRRRA